MPEEYVAFVKQVTSKPVVGVGRFTSPDTMGGQLNRGVLDLIGAAREVGTIGFVRWYLTRLLLSHSEDVEVLTAGQAR